MKFQIAIFDCDGVLFDSKSANQAYYNHILSKIGRDPMTDEEFEYVHMHTAADSLAYLFPDKDDLKKALEYASKVDYADFIPFMLMEDGVIETLEAIRPPIKTAISTNRSTTMPRLILEFQLDRWFDLIVCAMDVERPKPHPEGVFKILKELGCNSEKAVYIGDSKVDEEVAKRAGLPLIAYKNPKLDAQFHVKHFSEIRDILLNN